MFDWEILLPPLLAGLLVLVSHVPMGRVVLSRGIIFLDLAVAQMAGLGVILAKGMALVQSAWLLQLTAFAAALSGAGVLYLTDRLWPRHQEAIIGVAFVVAASGGILLLAGSPHGGEQLRELLVGQILWVDMDHVGFGAVLTGLIMAAWLYFRAGRNRLAFYFLFALAVTQSVQLVGVYLVFASLIIPALAVVGMNKRGTVMAYGLAALAYALGLLLSTWLDLPAGAVIVWCLLAVTLLFRLARRLGYPGGGERPLV